MARWRFWTRLPPGDIDRTKNELDRATAELARAKAQRPVVNAVVERAARLRERNGLQEAMIQLIRGVR